MQKSSTCNVKRCWIAENRLVFLQSERLWIKLTFIFKNCHVLLKLIIGKPVFCFKKFWSLWKWVPIKLYTTVQFLVVKVSLFFKNLIHRKTTLFNNVSYGFTSVSRFGVFSVFCSRDLAIKPSAKPLPCLNFYMNEHVNHKEQRPTVKKRSWSKIVPTLHQGS